MDNKTLGIITLSIGALALVVVSAYQLYIHNLDVAGASRVTIYQLGSEEEATQVNETALREEVPRLAKALDTMIEEGDDQKIFPRNETHNAWFEHLREQDAGGPFRYEGHTFELGIQEG